MERGTSYRSLSRSAEDTSRLGRTLGGLLGPGDTVFIYGGVGAGKTVFVKGLASRFNIRGYVTSPTFTILNIYNGDIVLYHYDAYRIESPEELYDTGFFEFIDGGVVVVEWADRIAGCKPERCVEVWLERVPGRDNERQVKIEFNGF